MASFELTVPKIKDATGIEDPEIIEEIEILFAEIHGLGTALQYCKALRSFTLIDTGLRSFSGLEFVESTLLRLCISEQQHLEVIEPALNLPHLRDLLLHNNGLKRISGLQGCPKLQRLWLQSNQIQVLEGLETLGDLRELWVQNNQISRISGVEHLVNLHVLSLAGNPIADLRDIQKLSHLPLLRSFSLQDVHYGACPAVQTPNYIHYCVTALPSVTSIDGIAVDAQTRKSAELEMLATAAQFARRIENVTQEQEAAIAAVRARKARHQREAQVLAEELSQSFAALAAIVTEGEAKMHAEADRVNSSTKKTDMVFAEELKRIEMTAMQQIQQSLQSNATATNQEARLLQALKARAIIERQEYTILADLASACVPEAYQIMWQKITSFVSTNIPQQKIVASALSDHSPEFRSLSALFFEAKTNLSTSDRTDISAATDTHVQGLQRNDVRLAVRLQADDTAHLSSVVALWHRIPDEYKSKLVDTQPYEGDINLLRKLVASKQIAWSLDNLRTIAKPHLDFTLDNLTNDGLRIVKAWHLQSIQPKCTRLGGDGHLKGFICMPKALLHFCLTHNSSEQERFDWNTIQTNLATNSPLIVYTRPEDAICFRGLYDSILQSDQSTSSTNLDESLYCAPSEPYAKTHALLCVEYSLDLKSGITCPSSILEQSVDQESLFNTLSHICQQHYATHAVLPISYEENKQNSGNTNNTQACAIVIQDHTRVQISPEFYVIAGKASSPVGVSTYLPYVDHILEQIIKSVDIGAASMVKPENETEDNATSKSSNVPSGLKQMAAYDRQLERSAAIHAQRLALELAPDVAEGLESTADEVVALEHEIASLRSAIEREKQAQEVILQQQFKQGGMM